MKLLKTVDPSVFVEEVSDGYTRYRMVDDTGVVIRRWEVFGKCQYIGNCLIGAVIDGEIIKDHEHLAEISMTKKARLDSELDVPVTPEFKDCCPFTYRELSI